MKHNLLKSVIISVILLMGVSNAWAEPWLCRSTAGGKIATKTVGDKLNNGNEWNYEYTTNGGWSSATDIQVYVGTSTSSYTTVNAGWKSDDGDNKNVAANIGSVSFDKSGKWYAVGKYKSGNTTAYTTKKDEWTNNTTLSMGSNDEPYWEVTPPAVSSFSVSVSGYLSGTGTSNDPYVIQPGNSLQLTLSGNKAKTDANSTIQYNTAGTWNTTNSRTISNITSITKTSVTVKMRCYNSTASLSGTESSKTIYYRAQSFAVTISAGANGSVAPTGSQQVGSTNVTIKATANTGYKFKNWTKTGGVVIANANNATTTITATANGTVTANFEEDLTSTWHIVGDPTSIFKGTSTWAAHNDNMLKKTTGASTASKGSLTIDVKTLPANNDSYQFKVLNTNGTKWYGWSDREHYWVNRTNNTTNVYNADDNNLYFIPDALGDYKFDVDWSSSNPSLKVTFPTAYTVTFDKGTGGSSVTAKYSNTSFSSGKKVQSGKTVTFTQTASAGYTFKEWNTKSDGKGTTLSTNATYTHTVAATNTVYAIYTKKPDKTIYLEPTGHWNANKAVFQAHVWQSSNTGNSRNIDMTVIGDPSYANNDGKSLYRYYKVEVPAEYDKIVFYRVNPSNTSTIWNQTGDLTIPTNNQTLYVITNNEVSPATGTWKAANLVYTITLGYCDFGTYGIKYNGQSYFSKKPYDNVTIDVPAGAQIEILEGQPHSNAYTGDVIKSKPTKEKLTTDQTLTINGDVTLDDNFITTTEHVVYLGIPDAINTKEIWAKADKANFIYTWDTYASYGLVASTRSFRIDALGITYYEFTIPEKRHSFRFQRKSSLNDNGSPHCESVSLEHEIPLTDVNCFTLKNEKDDNNRYKGTWGTLPAKQGDHRLLYIEQEVGLKNGHPETTVTKAHPSDIIRQGDNRTTYSLHIYNKVENGKNGMNDPEILLQECTGYNGENPIWTTRERHMVFGPLHADFGMAAMPGRRDAAGDPAVLRYDNGIENIKSDDHADNGSGVWNFFVTRDGSYNFTGLNLSETKRYTGEYYIRTDNAEGRWDQYTLNDNYMTYSQYAKDHSGFSHYFCRWVEVKKDKNTRFVIANDYGIAISDTLAKDAYTNEHGDIAHDANIRWSWNMVNNEIARAYIQGTWDVSTSKRNRNLVVNYKSSSSAADATDLLDDSGDWIYQKDFTVKVGSHLNSLTAQYPVSTGSTQTFASNLDMLTGNPANTNEYKVRILYDFKINKTLVALVPDNGKQADIAIDVIIERVDQKPATQVQAQVNATRTEGSTVYAVMSFTKNHITGGASKYAKQFYWISFPFDVRVSDVFGFGEYGKHWIIQWYDGAERAKNGCWIDSPTYWRFQTDTTDYVLEAGKGYVLTLDLAEMDVFTNTNQVSLYFPSRQTVKTVDGEIIHELNTTTLAPYTCTIQRNDRYIKDSHWHMLGVPSYANKNKTFTQDKVAYFYQYNSANDTYTPTSSGSFNFNSMFSYMVQFAGTINWSEFTFTENGGQGLAAKRNTDNANDKHVLRLELQKNNAFVDQTFIQLQAEEATEMFDMNLDLTKMVNSGNNIYSLISGTESNIEVAANVMPIAETIIPLGVKITAAGEYTFAMPEGTDGIVVELIDYEANTTTNLLFNDYTISLPKGTFDNRFALSVKPDKTATSLENIFNEATGDEVKKYIIDGVLYMQKDGVLYDAQGHIVR